MSSKIKIFILGTLICVLIFVMSGCKREAEHIFSLELKNIAFQNIEADTSKITANYNDNGNIQILNESNGKFNVGKKFNLSELKSNLTVKYSGVDCIIHNITKENGQFIVTAIVGATKEYPETITGRVENKNMGDSFLCGNVAVKYEGQTLATTDPQGNFSIENIFGDVELSFERDGVDTKWLSYKVGASASPVTVKFDTRSMHTHYIRIHNTGFEVPEEPLFAVNTDGEAISLIYVDDYYPYVSKWDPSIKGYYYAITGDMYHELTFFCEGYDIYSGGDSYDDSEKITSYFLVAVEDERELTEDAGFVFSGKIVDAMTGEIGVPGVEIHINGVLIYTTDETGNYGIKNLFVPTMIIFTKGGCSFNPAYAYAMETTEGFRVWVTGNLN